MVQYMGNTLVALCQSQVVYALIQIISAEINAWSHKCRGFRGQILIIKVTNSKLEEILNQINYKIANPLVHEQ